MSVVFGVWFFQIWEMYFTMYLNFFCRVCTLVPATLLSPFLLPCSAQTSNTGIPTVTVKNGTYAGRYLPGWDQELFLGLPFARPPVGSLRFKWPQELNSSFTGTRDASQYGYSCYQYMSNFNLSEDCLTLNVIRPHGHEDAPLPVLVWIYGEAFLGGSTADPWYNLSGIVRTSQDIGQPMIAVSMNYRIGMWGFLQTPQILAEGSSNAGLLDQRLAFRWIHENIVSFGGDPNRVTIWGESAGAQSIGLHLHSYDGRDDNLFQAAILESGGPVGTALLPLAYYASPVENLTRTVGCGTASDQLTCLRSLSSEALFAAHSSQAWFPLVDGDFLTAYPSTLMASGTHIQVPLLIGTNTDEGIFFGTKGLDNTTAVFKSLLSYHRYAISPPSARTLLSLYPDNNSISPPYHITTNATLPSNGLQWRRACAIAGDLVMVAGRRKVCEEFALGSGLDVWSYRFDTPSWNASVWDGVSHFANSAFSFQNISGNLGPVPEFESYARLSRGIGEAYVRFVNGRDPNAGTGGSGNASLPFWPKWRDRERVSMVLNSNGSFVERDDFREEGIRFINSIDRELLC